MLIFQGEFTGQKSTKLHQLILNGEVEEVEKLLIKGTSTKQLFLFSVTRFTVAFYDTNELPALPTYVGSRFSSLELVLVISTIIGYFYWNDIPISIRKKPTRKLIKWQLYQYYFFCSVLITAILSFVTSILKNSRFLVSSLMLCFHFHLRKKKVISFKRVYNKYNYTVKTRE